MRFRLRVYQKSDGQLIAEMLANDIGILQKCAKSVLPEPSPPGDNPVINEWREWRITEVAGCKAPNWEKLSGGL